MISVRAEENRYLVTAGGRDAALLRRIPGVRQIGATGALQAPRHPGTILALDSLFGSDGWEHPSDLSIEVVEARDREHAPAQGEASVELEGKELSITCQYGDKELVKLVPGYRWSAAQRRWYVPAQPMALEILQRHFGPNLEVKEAARDYLALKEIDEREAFERAARLPDAIADPPVSTPGPPGPSQSLPAAAEGIGGGDGAEPALLERLERLAGAVEELVALLRPTLASEAPGSQPAPQEPELSSVGEPESADWRELLLGVHRDAAGTLPRVSALLQTAAPEQLGSLRALAGIGEGALGDDKTALQTLRRALDDAVPLDAELAGLAREAYTRSALRMLAGAVGPVRAVEHPEGVLELLRIEIHRAGTGFSEAELTSKEAASILEYLINDPVLRLASSTLSDCCRVAHLLAVSRSGSWMVVDRVTDLLRDREIGPDGFGLAVAILANALFEASSMDEWRYRWPSDDSAKTELRWLAETSLARLAGAHSETAQLAALACLACIAGGPVDWASVEVRRQVVKLIPVTSRVRPYAEFLAGFQLAANGMKRVADQFPGYLSVLQEQPLARSHSHLLDVFVMQESRHSGLAHRIADEVVVAALKTRGLAVPNVLIELLDLVAEAPKGDTRLNEIAAMIEDNEFVGAEAFSHQQRLTIFGRALEEARKRGHDVDGERAFDRMVREHFAHGEVSELLTLSEGLVANFKAVRVRAAALEVLLELQLSGGYPFEATADELLKLAERPEAEELRYGLRGLAAAYPHAAGALIPAGETEAPEIPAGLRVVLVGGHQWLKKHATPVLEGVWKLDVRWLDPQSAKNGQQAIDLASGSTDLLVINEACIGHAASGRVLEAAKKANVNYVEQHARGVGTLLGCVAEKLRDLSQQKDGPKDGVPPRKPRNRNHLVR